MSLRPQPARAASKAKRPHPADDGCLPLRDKKLTLKLYKLLELSASCGKHRTASRPGLAAARNQKGRSNVVLATLPFVHAASPGRLAVRSFRASRPHGGTAAGKPRDFVYLIPR